jgi:hypothetical protein
MRCCRSSTDGSAVSPIIFSAKSGQQTTATFVLLLVETDAESSHQSHIYTRRHHKGVGLLAEEEVAAAEKLAVDAGDDAAGALVNYVGGSIEPIA